MKNSELENELLKDGFSLTKERNPEELNITIIAYLERNNIPNKIKKKYNKYSTVNYIEDGVENFGVRYSIPMQ